MTADQVEAEADNGLLRLRIKNVTKPVEAPRKIQIKSGDKPVIEAKPGDVKSH